MEIKEKGSQGWVAHHAEQKGSSKKGKIPGVNTAVGVVAVARPPRSQGRVWRAVGKNEKVHRSVKWGRMYCR